MKNKMKNKPVALTKLLESNNLSLNANSIFTILLKIGILREVNYSSTTGSGETKSFKELSPEYSIYGVNARTPHEFITALKFYPSEFKSLINLVFEELKSEIEKM